MERLDFSGESTLLLIAIIYGFVFSGLVLFRNWKKKNQHFWLGIFILAFTFTIVDSYLRTIGFNQVFKAFDWTYYRVNTLIPITLWTYISVLVHSKLHIKVFEKVLFTFLFVEVFLRIYMFIIAALGYSDLHRFTDLVLDTWFEICTIVLCVGVMIAGIRKINSYQLRLENNYSSTEEKELRWVKELLWILLGVILVWITVVPVTFLTGVHLFSAYWIWAAQALVVFYFGVRGHFQPEIFHEFQLSPSFQENTQELQKSPSQSVNAEVDQGAIDQRVTLIEKSLKEDKIYRRPKLTLNDMARELDIAPRQLSTLINEHYNYSFSDFINQHRVEEIKERIRQNEDEKLTLLALAYDAGFNSKSSFNFMFKKFTAQTPAQFKNSLKTQ